MKILNYIGYIFISLIVSTTVLYIIGAIGSATTDLKQWDQGARFAFTFVDFLTTLFLSVALINKSMEEDNNSSKKGY